MYILIILTSTGIIFNDFLQGQRIICLGSSAPEGVARNFSRRRTDVGYYGWERTFCDFRLAKIFTSGIVLACVLNPPSKPQPRIFFCPSNLLHIFNNNIYTDIRTAYKHIFYQILSYKANICGRNSSSPPRHPLFSDPHFQNFGLKVVPLERGGWYCVGFFLIYFTHLKLPILKLILYSHNRIFKLCKSLKTTYTFSHKIKLIFLTPNKTEK